MQLLITLILETAVGPSKKVQDFYSESLAMGIQDKDIEIISNSFMNLDQLFLKEAKISNDSAFSFAKMSQLTKLELSWCRQIEDLSFLEKLDSLANLNFTGCKQIKDLSFLERLIQLASLNLSGCTEIKDFSSLNKCPSLRRVTKK